tara:strand:- start:194 stop:577 length:384 start_codon:yes stop_codon:yes gene_type:complete
MNHSLPIQSYLQNDINQKVENNNPHGVIEQILIELKKNLSTLAYCLKDKGHMPEAKSKCFSKSLTAIYILQSSLDFKSGGDIAQNLFELYDFCKTTIIKSFSKNDFEAIFKVIDIISEILDGWKSIK